MKKVVVDSSVAIKWFVPQPYSTEARTILNGYQNGTLAILAPDLIYAEVGNIVWKLQRFQDLSQEDADDILDAFKEIEFEITALSSLLADAYRLAVDYQRTVYDSLYIALSLQQKCPFVTGDRKLVNSVSNSLPNVIGIEQWTEK